MKSNMYANIDYGHQCFTETQFDEGRVGPVSTVITPCFSVAV